MKVVLANRHSIEDRYLKELSPILDREGVTLADIPFEKMPLHVEKYDKDTDTLVIGSVYAF